MSPSIHIPTKTYERLEKQAKGFDTPANVIARMLDHCEQCEIEFKKSQNTEKFEKSKRTKGASIAEWKECIEIALGFKSGSTPLDQNANFFRNIYAKFRKGEPAYGVSGANAMEALLQVIEEKNPNHYEPALQGLKASILEQEKYKPFRKLRRLYERLSGESLPLTKNRGSLSMNNSGRLLQKGNGNQAANKRAAFRWLLENISNSKPSHQKELAISLPTGHYRVMASAEQNGLMLSNTKRAKDDDSLPGWISNGIYDGMLVVRQFSDGTVKGYQFDNLPELWKAKNRMVGISWDIAENYATVIA